jgi:vancomycin resistance protein YoaR
VFPNESVPRVTDQPTRLDDTRPDEQPSSPTVAAAAAEPEQAETADVQTEISVGPAEPDGQAETADGQAESGVVDDSQVDRSSGGSFWRRRSTMIAGGAVAGVVLLYTGAYLAAGRDLASGATVLGVEVGGLSPQEAEARLATELPPLVDVPIPARVGDDEATYSIVPADAGLRIDVPATVDGVPGVSANPISLVRALFGAGEIDPVPAVDRAALESAITAIAEQADTEAVNGSVAFEAGAVVTSAAVPGRAVDVEAAADAVEDAFFGDGSTELPVAEVSLPTTEVQPAVTDEEVERAVAEFAEPAMSGPVTVVAGDESAALEPEVIGAALTMAPGEDGTLTPALDGAALAAAAEDALAEIGQEGRDATIRIQGGRPVVIPAETGRGVVPDALSAAVLPALTAVGDARTATVELTEIEPELTTEGAEQLGVKEVVAEWSTYFPHADYRNQNIGLAAERIDNTLLIPGDTFSLNDLVGERTGANGFAEGWTIDGGRLKKDFGGGVSQVATTTYHAAFLAGLEDVYHQPHSIYFDRYPVGQEATVSWGDFDMSFKNDTPYGVLVDTAFTPSSADSRGSLTVRIWSTTHFRVETSVSDRSKVTSPPTVYDTSAECQAEAGWEGFSITSYRKVWTPDGTLVKDEADPWTYRPNPTVVCGPKP